MDQMPNCRPTESASKHTHMHTHTHTYLNWPIFYSFYGSVQVPNSLLR